MKITVYEKIRDIKPTVIQNATVVLADVLRASSTISTLLYHGAQGVQLCADPGTARKLFSKMKRGEGLLAGEKDWDKISGFQLGGSPLDSNRDKVKDRTICFYSDSSLKPVKNAKYVIVGSFLNLGDTYDACLRGKRDVVIACAGGQEDLVFAGMLVDFLQSTLGSEPILLAESAKEAMAQYKPWQGRIPEMLEQCEEGKELAKEGYAKDLDFCSKVSRFSVVPYLKDNLFVRENLPKPKKLLTPEGKPKTGPGAPQKGKSIKVTVPLFPKNPEHPVPGMEKAAAKKQAESAAAEAKASPKKGELPPEAKTKGKKAHGKPVPMFSKKTVATAPMVLMKKEAPKKEIPKAKKKK